MPLQRLRSVGSKSTHAYSGDLRRFVTTSSDNSAEIVGGDHTDEVIEEFREELASLRGTPELVDRLENLVMKHPGIENNINLYRAIYPFTLDDFQEQGLQSLQSGNNVLVTTPTGSGKTVVGELAIYFALMLGLRVAYTTPLKALSNQKFSDFKKKYGGDRVGLLTGDIAINRGAPITVMTTEVFRNMIYDKDSDLQLSNLFMVCFDEFHYMNDPDRGTVWEESIISCPPSVRVLALSATMGNVGDIKGWMDSIHGPTGLVQSTHRPVPLKYMFALRQGIMPLFKDPQGGPGAPNGVRRGGKGGSLATGSTLNPAIVKIEESALRKAQTRSMTKTGRPLKNNNRNPNQLVPKYSDVAEELNRLKLLPAIVFIFSRVGCEQSAKMVMNTKAKLLTPEEQEYVSDAITQFARKNPDIPIQKSAVLMLRAGVAVHHAGLLPVWKALIEDLFNANKIKVLFATETLAAGVNMPARTTVITTVTKRIASETVRLKTSQLLQMAGRAGRRGLDTEGTVVMMRSRFEDARMGHKILTSNVDGIKSHFKTSYSLTVKLLKTKSVEECRQLIERGFGAYLLQQRMLKKVAASENSDVEDYREVLQRYSLKKAREYLKLERRLEKEKRNGQFLEQKLEETANDLVNAIADYMPMGIGLRLKTGEQGYFLGDIRWGVTERYNGFGVVTQDGKLLVVAKQHIAHFAEPDSCLAVRQAQVLLDILGAANAWDEQPVEGCKKDILVAEPSPLQQEPYLSSDQVREVLAMVRDSDSFAAPEQPGSLIRHAEAVEALEVELRETEVVQNGEQELVLDALRYAAALRDPVAFVNNDGGQGGSDPSKNTVFAWRMFQAVMKVLQHFEALEGEEGTTASVLGDFVGSLSADNELWLALVLSHEGITPLSPGELASVVCACVLDSFKAQNAYFRRGPSERVSALLADLEPMMFDLKMVQAEHGVEYPINLAGEAAGLTETWAEGSISWRDLCQDTSLDQGDVCRILRRTVEALRQLPQALGVSAELADKAVAAANAMDRFPVADLVDPSEQKDGSAAVQDNSGAGFGLGLGGDVTLVDDGAFEDDEKKKGNGKGIAKRAAARAAAEGGGQFNLDRFLAEEEDDRGNAMEEDLRMDLDAELFKWSEGRIGMAASVGGEVDLDAGGESGDEDDIDVDAILGLKSEGEQDEEEASS